MFRYVQYPSAWTRFTWLTLLLLPLSWLFGALAALRRALFRTGVLKRSRLPVPVIVVGNISVGGTGKTPLVIWLAAQLKAAGFVPGIISRGYGGAGRAPRAVLPNDSPRECGDEPVLLARRCGCPVWIGAKRVEAAQALLAANPACNVIISDDGLQHYALARDAEIAVIDGARGLSTGRLLPAGPLREPPSRLQTVDAVVVRLPVAADVHVEASAFGMTLLASGFSNVRDPTKCVDAEYFKNQRVHAVAGIGNPQQFFDSLTRMGLAHTPHAYPDHHAFSAADLQFADCDAIVMTEKDAVKCESVAAATHWVLNVQAQIENGDALMQRLLQKIKR